MTTGFRTTLDIDSPDDELFRALFGADAAQREYLQDILVRRYDGVEEKTQAEIGAEIGLSQMQISRILSRTLAAIRTEMDKD